MIKFNQVTLRYANGHEALRRLSFQLGKGQMAFLTGHSGAGKSSLLKLIPVFERVTQGEILVNGLNLNRVSNKKIPFVRRQIGMVFQDHRLLYDRNVFDNVAIALQISGCPYREVGRRVRASLDKVGLLSKEHLSPLQLSSGEQQRVGIARAVVNRPPLILADGH